MGGKNADSKWRHHRVLVTAIVLSLSGIPLIAHGNPLTKIAILPTDNPIVWSSPILVDLDGDPKTREILVGDEGGTIYAFSSDLNPIWTYSIRQFPQPENQFLDSPVHSSPAVADIDNDGLLEVAVTLGDRYNRFKPGRLFMFHLDQNGRNPSPGFYLVPDDRVEGPNGVPDAFGSSPVLHDLNGDGDLEILACGFDYFLYAVDWQGNPLWNLDYNQEMPGENFFYAGDTMWGDPVILDINNDGAPNILFGIDNGLDRFGFTQVPYAAKMGGALISLNHDGTVATGAFMWEHYAPEGYLASADDHYCRVNPSVGLQSTPVVADVDADGKLEVLIGGGQYYGPPKLDGRHNRVFCYNIEDDSPVTDSTFDGVQKTPLWTSPDLGKDVFMTMSVGNLDSEPDLEVVARTIEETNPQVFVFKGFTGEMLPGFPQPLAFGSGNGRAIGCAIVDVDGDDRNDILMPSYRNLSIFGSDGTLKGHVGIDVTHENWDNDWMPGIFFTAPAAGDIDNDGRVEVLIAQNDGLHVFKGGDAGPVAWGQNLLNPRNNAVLPVQDATLIDLQLPGTVNAGQSFTVDVTLRNEGSAAWTPSTHYIETLSGGSQPTIVGLPPGTMVETGDSFSMQFSQTAPADAGDRQMVWQMSADSGELFGDPITASLSVQKVELSERAEKVREFLLGINPTLTAAERTSLDPNEDGVVNIADLHYLIRTGD